MLTSAPHSSAMKDNIFASAPVQRCAYVRAMLSLLHVNCVALPRSQIYRCISVFESYRVSTNSILNLTMFWTFLLSHFGWILCIHSLPSDKYVSVQAYKIPTHASWWQLYKEICRRHSYCSTLSNHNIQNTRFALIIPHALVDHVNLTMQISTTTC